MVKMERWLPVVEWEEFYQVSDKGKVRSLDRLDDKGRFRKGRLLKQQLDNSGYPIVRPYAHGHGTTKRVAVLVAEAFIGPRPDGQEICHNDGNKLNSSLDNLRWDTRVNNRYDSTRHGTDFQANKTHCPQGHEYNEKNTIFKRWKTGPNAGKVGRICKICDREFHKLRERARRERLRRERETNQDS